MGILDGLLGLLLGGGNSTADDATAVLNSAGANAAALSSAAAANSDVLVNDVIEGMTTMINTTLETTFTGVQALTESSMAGSAEAMNSVATTAINFTEVSSSKTYNCSGALLQETQSVSHDGGAAIMSAYAAQTLGPLMAGVGEGVAGMMTGVGSGAGNAMANLGNSLPAALPGLATSLGASITASMGLAQLFGNSCL